MMSENWGLYGMVLFIDIDIDVIVYVGGLKVLILIVEIDFVVVMFGIKYKF